MTFRTLEGRLKRLESISSPDRYDIMAPELRRRMIFLLAKKGTIGLPGGEERELREIRREYGGKLSASGGVSDPRRLEQILNEAAADNPDIRQFATEDTWSTTCHVRRNQALMGFRSALTKVDLPQGVKRKADDLLTRCWGEQRSQSERDRLDCEGSEGCGSRRRGATAAGISGSCTRLKNQNRCGRLG